MALRAISSGTISFGLVSIPVKLFTAASSQQIHFNLLHEECGSRVKRQFYCPVHNTVMGSKDTIKGYEFSRGQFVRFTEEELKALEADRDSSINIVEFVPLSCFDMIQIEKSYYLGPEKGGDKAYRLLSESMTKCGKVAVGRWSARGKEQLVVVRPYRDGLIFHQMYYADEVRAFDEVDTGAKLDFADIERELAEKLIEQLSSKTFDADKYDDSFRTRVLSAVEQKVQGQQIQFSPEAPKAQIIDLFEALKQSLASTTADADSGKGESAASTGPSVPKKAKADKPKVSRRAKSSTG